VLGSDDYLLNPMDFSVAVCEVRAEFIYIHSGAGLESNATWQHGLDWQLHQAKIVRTTFKDGDLFALALGTYFDADFVILIDILKFDDFDRN
jgi:hypothetical protein